MWVSEGARILPVAVPLRVRVEELMKLVCRRFAFVALAFLFAIPAFANLTVTPLTWNVIGLDSNSPTSGPRYFPVGARVCSNVATLNVAVNFVFDSANANVNLRAGSPSTLNIASIGAGNCADAYFEAEVNQVAGAYDTTRRYHLTAQDGSGTFSSVTPRELYVEHLISQNRNSITDVKFGTTLLNVASVPAGGSMNMIVGNTYIVQLFGGTATQGYNQFEAFINFPNTIFQILGVSTNYSADNSPYVPNPNDKLYADACQWSNDPNAPTYRSCIGGDFKAGGSNVVTTYTIKVISGGGTSQPLNTLLYDFSGSSYHYNADFTAGARIANVIDPTTANISKAFSPNPISINGVAALKITLTNPNGGTLGGYNFVDNFPANLTVANPPNATTSGCGTPTFSPTAGATSISFSNGTLAANSNCVVSVNVTPSTTGVFNNTTNDLFIDSIDTNHSGNASLTVNNAPPPGTGLCGITLANWSVPNGTTANPPDLTGGVPTVKAANVTTATASAINPADTAIDASLGHIDTTSWKTFGYKDAGQFIQFTVDTTNYTAVLFSYWVANPSPSNGPSTITVTVNAGAGFGGAVQTISSPVAGFTQHGIDLTGLTNTSGNTIVRLTATGANNNAGGASLQYDDIVFTGCTTATKATIAKSFAPNPIALNAVSTLTFTLTNTNTAALTGAAFTDSLPAGVQVAATPSASTSCAGATWAPAAGNTSLTFSGGTIPASGSCTVSVNVTATTSGPHSNTTGYLSTTEGGTNTTSVGTSTLTAGLPPSMTKSFLPNPILANGVSTLTFIITNPNQNNSIGGVQFSDTFPASPGAMVVAATPNATTSGCGAPTFTPVAGAGSISFSNATIAAGGTCTVSVNITAPATGSYHNTSGAVTHTINATLISGNTASADLDVTAPHPSIGLAKQIGLSAAGPWLSFLAVTPGTQVWYQFTVENTGDVPLSPVSITDNTLNGSACNAGWSAITLPVAVPANDNHIVTCVVGPVVTTSGSHTNTAHSTGTYLGTPYNSPNDTATYATTGLTLGKSATESSFTNPGDVLHYSYQVSNSGFAPLLGPVTISDNKTTVTCPAVNTVGDLDDYLDPGESMVCTATYTITGTDVTNAQVTNTAQATCDSVQSNQSSKLVPLSTSADVEMVKTLITGGPFHAGDSIQYTLQVMNNGPATATNVQVTDTPANLTITNVTGSGCSLPFPCIIASLANGANTSITVTATINAAGAFDNSATVSATQPDPVPGNNTDNTGNGSTATASADVEIAKAITLGGPTFHAGDSIQYTLQVTNHGPSTATNVTVADTPSNLSITNVTGGGCSLPLPCNIGSLINGASASITVTATIVAAGSFDNFATVAATQPDPVPGNNTDNTGNGGTAVAAADLQMVKTLTVGGPTFHAGDSIQYSLQVTNNGPSTATTVQISDTPSNLTITNVTGGGCSFPLPCTIASLANGASVTITVTATITAAGAFDNSASVIAVEFDPNLTNNTDNTGNGGSAVASADVQVVKTLTTGGPFHAGDVIHYSVTVTNNGPSTANNVQVTDTPSNLAITVVSSTNCSAFPCTIPSLANGASEIIAVTATITAAGAFDNSASVTATEFDPVPGNNTDNTGNGGTAVASADVQVVKTLTSGGPFHIGDSIQYSLVVTNNGPSTATNAQIADTPTNLNITNITGGGCSVPFPCTIASLANGANATLTVTATITATGTFDNSATVTANEFDPVPGNNTDNTGNSGSASASADVAIVKTLTTGGPFHAGDSIQYTLQVTNNGPSTATNVQITDTPSNLSITNITGAGCSVPFPCTIASLANGANANITVTATIIAAGAFDNTATVSATEFDPISGNNTDSTGKGGPAGAAADVQLVKTLDPAGPFHTADTIQYTITVTNNGPSTATNIQVTDTPSNLTITNIAGSGCSVPFPCTIASLANGANTVITVTAKINGAGAFNNSATATGAEFDPNTGNNTDNTGNGGSATASADEAIVKTLTTAAPYTATQSISYTLLVTNNGPSTATNVQVNDTPTNLTITNVSSTNCSALPCTIPSLTNGASESITVTATIDSEGSFDNTANVTATELDPDSGNNDDFTGNGGNAAGAADVYVTKNFITAGPYTLGQTIQYSVVAGNNGPSTATNVQVTDTPGNLTITGVSSTNCSAFPCTIPSLANGAIEIITVTATIDAISFDNSATVSATEFDPDSSNNTDNTGNAGLTGASADMSMVKTLTTAGPFIHGQTIQYTLLVTNNGPSTATNVQITDTPSNLTINSATSTNCSGLPCTIASMANGATETITVTATINAPGAFDNSATVSATEGDPNLANNTDNSGNGGTAAASADVSMVKTLTTAGPFTIGQTISYTLTVANGGPSTATSIQVTDTPSNLTITNITGSGCSVPFPCTIASLAPLANTVINVTATINAAGAFDNSATATAATSDPVPGNNTDNTGNGGSAGASADVSMVKTLTTAGPFVQGQSISYTLTVANAGPSTATNISVTDTPSNLTITNVTGSGCSVPFPCTIASLASGANTVITVTATINAAGAFDNSATATGAETDPLPGNNTDNTGNGGSATPSADVSMVKTLTTAGPFLAGQSISYTLTVANAGPSAATLIQVTDTPANLSITNVSGACVALPCTIASLASGANTVINVTATIVTSGAFDNSATASGKENDPVPGNNTDNTGNGGSASPAADVSMVKTLTTVGPYSAGQTVTYTLLVANAGPTTATSILVTDTPTNLTITNVSGSGCPSTFPCTIASLGAGANTTITVTATINAAGAFTNSATATAIEADPNPANNTSIVPGLPGVSADVSVVKTLTTAGPFTAGQTVSYTLVVANAGPSPATNINVTDTPANLNITGVTGACTTLPCTIPSLAVGANTTINVTATIIATGAFDNATTVSATEPDPNLANNTDNTGNGGTASAVSVDVGIIKMASVTHVSVGQTFDYTLTVVDHGPGTATGVTVTDPLPPNFQLISATSTQGSCSGTTTVTCSVGTMLNGATVTITLHGLVTAAGQLNNTATVTINEVDGVISNNSSIATLAATVNQIPTLSEWMLMLLAIMLGFAAVIVMKR